MAGIYCGNNEIQGVYIGNTPVVGVFLGAVQIWPTEKWEVISVAIEKLREEIVTIADAIGGEAVTKVYFKAIEKQRSDKGNERDIEKELDIEVKYQFGVATVEEERTHTASSVYTDALGTDHTITGTVKQAALEWTLVGYYCDYGDAVATTFAPVSGGYGESTVAITIMAKYTSNTYKDKTEEKITDTVTLKHYFSANSSVDISEYTVSTAYRHSEYGTFEVSGKVYQLGKIAIAIVSASVGDIPASGGGQSQCEVVYLLNGEQRTQTVTFAAVTAGRIPAEERERTLIGTRDITVTDGGESATTTISIYQEANVGTERFDRIEFGTPLLSVSDSITAAGGSLTATASATNTSYSYIEYTSGAKTDSVGTESDAEVEISFNGNSNRFSVSGNTVTHDSMLNVEGTDSVTVTATNKGDSTKTASDSSSATNTRTEVTTRTEYGTPTVSLDASLLTAAGGSIEISASVSNLAYYYSEYTSGYKTDEEYKAFLGDVNIEISPSARFSLSGTTISHESMGTDAVVDTVTVIVKNADDTSKDATDSASVENKIESTGKEIVNEGYTSHTHSISNIFGSLSYDVASAAGGELSPSLSWSCVDTVETYYTTASYFDKYVYTSGSSTLGEDYHEGETTRTNIENVTLTIDNHTGYELTFDYSGTGVHSKSGVVTVDSLGDNATDAVTDVAEITCAVSLSGNGTSASDSLSYTVRQAANTYTDSASESLYGMSLVDGNGESIKLLPATSTSVFAQIRKNVSTVRTYASGTEKSVDSSVEYMTSGVSFSADEPWITPTWVSQLNNYAYNTSVNGFVINVSKNDTSSNRSGHVTANALGDSVSRTISQGHS